jgi:hypothetical protein
MGEVDGAITSTSISKLEFERNFDADRRAYDEYLVG